MMECACGYEEGNKFIHSSNSKNYGEIRLGNKEANGRNNRKMGLR
jgi:hypothetical protein